MSSKINIEGAVARSRNQQELTRLSPSNSKDKFTTQSYLKKQNGLLSSQPFIQSSEQPLESQEEENDQKESPIFQANKPSGAFLNT